MAWIEEAARERLRSELAEALRDPVDLAVSTSESAASRQAVEVLEEIAALSPLVTVSRTPSSGRDPTIEVRGRQKGRVAFVGLPMGYEFPTLVEALRDASVGASALGEELRAQIAGLRTDRRLEVFTAPT